MPPPQVPTTAEPRRAEKRSLLDADYSSDENAEDEFETEKNLLDDLSMNQGRGANGTNGNSMQGFLTGATCPASDDIDDKCCICKDFFEIFFFQEREEWHFKDAVRVENKVYHPICYEDAREVNRHNNRLGIRDGRSFFLIPILKLFFYLNRSMIFWKILGNFFQKF